ncbi:1-phosphatidylinositol 3-phosphate 5-kinase FAB1 [Psilocybe cubensis]|uniref:1-phosphatidylinositol 3-phosphate 5-kinase FAB1 n=2 Tax=Psilocybe cubensis TaxID=181762 RepID=A0ACB8GHS7_PSICU|nr:1-phosphatidylinositol 3-phosphate 5-kinase FAB1 [Psilocybe cubensis]KAH9475049.1 1-phosphatidylinositol 3-phosphate 5-kinase FAB1 [Psilocybe cubensis]
MSQHKPLPDLPPNYALSVESRNHRAGLIRHFLEDIHEPGIEARRDGWVCVFEEALDEMSEEIERENWLAAVKRGKQLKKSLGKPSSSSKTIRATPVRAPPEAAKDSSKEDTTAGSQTSKDDTNILASTSTGPSPFQRLFDLNSRPHIPAGKHRPGHLLLCLSPHGRRLPLPTEDSGFDVLPANIGCTFSPATFTLKKTETESETTILYGLDGLEHDYLDTQLRLIGGTFTLKGVNSPMQHMLLSKVLRLAIYIHLALILEQRLLRDSGVEVKFTRPKLPVPSPSTPSNPALEKGVNQWRPTRPKMRNIPSSFTNFFMKRSLSHRSQTINSVGRGGSLDLTVNLVHAPTVDIPVDSSPRRSTDGHGFSGLRLNRFSFLGERRLSLRRSTHSSTPVDSGAITPSLPFVVALKRIEESKGFLSTSPGVILNAPKLLVDLADKENLSIADLENQPPKRRLKGDERLALTSLLGWDGKDAEGRGMSGILGFVRQQQISVLCSTHVPPVAPAKTPANVAPSPSLTNTSDIPSQGSSTFTTNSTASSSSGASVATVSPNNVKTPPFNLPTSGLSPCGKPHWITYRYYSNGDSTLGEWIEEFTKSSNLPCDRPECKFTRGQHEIRVIHDGVRITFRSSKTSTEAKKDEGETEGKSKEEKPVGTHDANEINDEQHISVWETCAVCNASTSRKLMDDGTYLISYAKFLELIIYSPSIHVLTPPLCDHTNPSSGPSNSLHPSRFNIIRHFSTPLGQISLSLSKIEDIFEFRVPRLQITRGTERSSPTPTRYDSKPEPETTVDKKKFLRKEIKRWWEGVADHIDKIEKVLNSEDATQKALPRLPSIDDEYAAFDVTAEGSGSVTPRAVSPLPSLPPTAPNSPSKDHGPNTSYFTTQSSVSTDTQASKAPTVPPKEDPGRLLSTLRHNFQKIEQSLYSQLAKTPETSLNDVRRSFIATGKGTQKRLKAWQKKHLSSSKAKEVGDLIAEEPEWWGKGCHAVPGGNIIVREDDWGSIIAHTLSTTDYQLELANLSIARAAFGASQPAATPRTITDSGTSSFFSVAAGYRLFASSSSKNQPDPDQEDVVWNEPEQYSAVISRKEHTRDPTSLLSIRDVLRQTSIPEQPSGTTTPSRFASLSNATAQIITGTKPTAVKAKANVGISKEAVDGTMDTSDSVETGIQLLQDLENSIPSPPPSVDSEKPSTGIVETHIRRVKDSSVVSANSAESQVTVGKDDIPPPLPPKDGQKTPNSVSSPSTPIPVTPEASAKSETVHHSTASGFASTLAHGINSAVRYVLHSETLSQPSTPPPPSSAKKHHALLADITTFDERPHIKYDWTIGKRLKFSCTVYYAKQFDVLRKRCGISDGFVQSLSRSTNWAAEGGKSKSNFWQTSDKRFVIKTLVNAWNVADLQVLVDLAPSYFRYMDATASRATVLAKLIGFYTVEIRNLETGAVQSKADLLVMENLFFDKKISKTFDLKGIQGRKVRSHGDTTKTLFDGEWIEGQQRTLTLVRPHSKLVLHEAIKHDAEFLSKSNIMDYSLLLGIDEEKKEIVCGLVDTIGSYTFAKTLEYKAKQGLQSGKEVTVMPPTEYQDRFVNALEGYFVACPDKWSKPLDESLVIHDPCLLPSIL